MSGLLYISKEEGRGTFVQFIGRRVDGFDAVFVTGSSRNTWSAGTTRIGGLS